VAGCTAVSHCLPFLLRSSSHPPLSANELAASLAPQGRTPRTGGHTAPPRPCRGKEYVDAFDPISIVAPRRPEWAPGYFPIDYSTPLEAATRSVCAMSMRYPPPAPRTRTAISACFSHQHQNSKDPNRRDAVFYLGFLCFLVGALWHSCGSPFPSTSRVDPARAGSLAPRVPDTVTSTANRATEARPRRKGTTSVGYPSLVEQGGTAAAVSTRAYRAGLCFVALRIGLHPRGSNRHPSASAVPHDGCPAGTNLSKVVTIFIQLSPSIDTGAVHRQCSSGRIKGLLNQTNEMLITSSWTATIPPFGLTRALRGSGSVAGHRDGGQSMNGVRVVPRRLYIY